LAHSLRRWRSISACALVACLSAGTSEPELSGSGAPVLFIGSLTFVNDVQGIVQALALSRSTLALYSDGLHASTAESYLSALTIYALLVHKTPVGLPASLTLRSGTRIAVDASTAAVLQAAAASVAGW
jgi:hypothetical protein